MKQFIDKILSILKRPGVRKGLIVLLVVVLAVSAAGAAVWHAVVKPVEIVQTAEPEPEPVTEQEPEKIQTPVQIAPVKKPTVVKTETKTDAESGEEVEIETEIPASHRENVFNILVCGTDDDGFRTDTMLVAHIDVSTHQTALMSIPRDTVISRGSGIAKLNSVYANGGETGMKRLQSQLETLLGFPTDGYVLIDLAAFQKVVDLLGGVWFDVPQDMKYSDASQDLFIDLKAGYQLLDGYNAMCLCRFRKGYASQDIQRTKVQQEFIKTVAKQCMGLKSLSKLKGLAEIAIEDMTTDLTVGNLLYFAKELDKCNLDEMQTYTVEGQGATINGLSYYPLFQWSILRIVNEAFNPYDAQITGANISVITPELAATFQKPEEPAEEEIPAEELPAEELTPEELPAEQDVIPEESIEGSEPELPPDPFTAFEEPDVEEIDIFE